MKVINIFKASRIFQWKKFSQEMFLIISAISQ